MRIKIESIKKVIQMILAGEKMPSLLMTVIKFLMPLQDHTIKKLLLIFWEIVPKTGPDGKLLHEMILVCDAYRKVSEKDDLGIPSVSWRPFVHTGQHRRNATVACTLGTI